MAERANSLDIVLGELVRAEADQAARAAGIDARAGVVLGFSGVLVGLVADKAAGALLPGVVVAFLASVAAILALLPRPFPLIGVRRLRDHYLGSDPAFTRRVVLDTRLDMLEETRTRVDAKARRLLWALILLVVSLAAVIGGVMWEVR